MGGTDTRWLSQLAISGERDSDIDRFPKLTCGSDCAADGAKLDQQLPEGLELDEAPVALAIATAGMSHADRTHSMPDSFGIVATDGLLD